MKNDQKADAARPSASSARADHSHDQADEAWTPPGAGGASAESDAAPSDADPPPGSPTDMVQRERDEYYELLLRKTAELDNYRKRVTRERRELEDAAAADLIEDLLPLIDDLERALGADTEMGSASAYRAGVELIHAQLIALLEKRGVARIDAVGQDFDPHVHQAVSTESAGTHREGEVVEELRRGYTLHGRLLRPAMVKVAKA